MAERLVDVDGEEVTFRVSLSQAVVASAWNPDESRVRAPSFSLSARSATRAAVLADPVSQPRLADYTDDALRELWRARWR